MKSQVGLEKPRIIPNKIFLTANLPLTITTFTKKKALCAVLWRRRAAVLYGGLWY